MLGHTKVIVLIELQQQLIRLQPAFAIYEACLNLLGRKPDEVAMVAAHAYDLRAAKKL